MASDTDYGASRPIQAKDIAVIGMACRFPGARNYSEYWNNLLSGANCIREVPLERWDWRGLPGSSSTPHQAAKMQWGGFIADVDKFDSLFFAISPAEAAFMDPQHRIFLESAWAAIEDAGYCVSQLSGAAIGVYAGVSKNDYSELMRESRAEITPYVSTGTVHSILANRVSFLLNLRGKSEVVDTACSSSLVALHNAIRDIASGECDAAIVGGVNALLTPTMFLSHSKSGMLSPDGQCKTFSAGANGYVRGEGVGVLFLKPLHQAVRDGDSVHAVIKSSAVNHGGRTNFLTSPSTEAQAAVVMKALRHAAIDPRSISYIETHGTGTPLGDPIEINALRKAFAELTQESPGTGERSEPYCALGSAKTNVGHLESASGMAGIIKVILSMKHRRIPAIRNFERLNPYIEIQQSPFFIATETTSWDSPEQPRRAGVSGFGMGGVNAHVILEEAPPHESMPENGPQDSVIMLSAKQGRLPAYARAMFAYLAECRSNADIECPSLRDVAYTLQTGREVFEQRLALVSASMEDLLQKLESYAASGIVSEDRCYLGSCSSNSNFPALKVTEANDLTEVAKRWAEGTYLDWSQYYAAPLPRRVWLATYPFEPKRCWFTDISPKNTAVASPASATITPRPSATQPTAGEASRFLHPTDFFIRDHVVQGKKMLPAVVHLEMARAAAKAGGDHVQFKDVYWMAPVLVSEDEVVVTIRVSPQQGNWAFSIASGNFLFSKGNIGRFSDGLEVGTRREPMPEKALHGFEQSALQPEIYSLLRKHGLAYGNSFQVIEKCQYNDEEIIAYLRLSESAAQEQEDYVLHPSLMDGVFQTMTLLSLFQAQGQEPQHIPFYLEEARVYGPLRGRCVVHARFNAPGAGGGKVKSLDADVRDDSGNILVMIRNLQKRPIAQPAEERRPADTGAHRPSEALPISYYRPIWTPEKVDKSFGSVDTASFNARTLIVFAHQPETALGLAACKGAFGAIVVVLPGDTYRRLEEHLYEINLGRANDLDMLMAQIMPTAVAGSFPSAGQTSLDILYLWSVREKQANDSITNSLELNIYGVLKVTQALYRAKFHGILRLIYVYALGQGFVQSIHAMVGGFARTLKYENPNFKCISAGLDNPTLENIDWLAHSEFGVAHKKNALLEVVYREGHRYQRRMIADTEFETGREKAGSLIRRGGTYLVTGGAGGLGFIISQYLAKQSGGTLVWLGRSALSPAIKARMEAIRACGGTCGYFSVDITNEQALGETLEQVGRDYPKLNGIVHAAGLIEDAFILRKQMESFAKVIAPKVLGTLNLDVLTRDETLDFFVLFSSIAALMPSQGQCDYAAANSFLDSFADVRNQLVVEKQRSGVTLSCNWSLWQQGGIRVTQQEEHHLAKVFGMVPLSTAEGLEIFEASLSMAARKFPNISQVIAIQGDQAKVELHLDVQAAIISDERELAGIATGQQETVSGDAITPVLKSIFAARLGVAPESIDSGRVLGELGVDSMAIIGFITDVNQRFAAELKPTLLFEIDTIDRLAIHLVTIGKGKAVVAGETQVVRWNRSLIDTQKSGASGMVFSRTFRTAEFYLRDHVVEGEYNMPGACYVEMARQAGDLYLGSGGIRRLINNYWSSPLSSSGEDFTASVEMTEKHGHIAYQIVSVLPTGERRLHAMGDMTTDAGNSPSAARLDVPAVIARCRDIRLPETVYKQIRSEGLKVGPTFQPMTQIYLGEGEALARLQLPEEVESTLRDYFLHPALLTGAFQTALISNKHLSFNERWYIPIGMDELELFAPISSPCYVHCQPQPINRLNEEIRKFDLNVCRLDGEVVVRLKGFSIRALKKTVPQPQPGKAAIVDSVQKPVGVGDLLVYARNLVREKMAGPVGVPANELDLFREFDLYGVTSVMIVELNEIFEAILGSIPKTLFFEYRNIAELAEHFVQKHGEALERLARETVKHVDKDADDEGTVNDYLRSLISGSLGLTADEMEFEHSFEEYGINSVVVVQLNEVFENIFGQIPKTLFFEFRNITELSHYFLEHHREQVLAQVSTTSYASLGREPEVQSETNRPSIPGDPDVRQAPDVVSPQFVSAEYAAQDIAIVGMAGRFPGARNLDEFWDVLREGRDCITTIPPDRFEYSKYFDSDPEQNRIYSRWGGFLDDVDKFDPLFFNISPREAELIDPQERLLLEVVWEMLERAGYTRERLLKLSQRQVGVFVGALWQPYESVGIAATSVGNVVAPSSLLYSIANRISYFFDLAGPSMAVDTACSSSLTALHLACQSIRTGESRCAIVGGVNLSLTVSKYLFLSQNRFLSTDGRCRSYGEGGDGYVPGEGVCSLLVKPLADGVADGDNILAVIKGSAINHGGRTNGYTVPNPKAQGAVIALALQRAGVDPRSVSYIEGHGTGTALGDPIEIAGLEKALSAEQQSSPANQGVQEKRDQCAIGSVKSNIGHLEAAAGIASTIKVILQMQHGQLVPSLHTEELNRNINFGQGLFHVQRELASWPRPKSGRRCAGVSSFGAGGANAHLILEEYSGPKPPVVAYHAGDPILFLFSARTGNQLRERVHLFQEYLRETDSQTLPAIAYTLQLGREAMKERLAIVAGSLPELNAALADFLDDRPGLRSRKGSVRKRSDKTAVPCEDAVNVNGNLLRIAEGWVLGDAIDWTSFYSGHAYGFLPLPTYPFAKDRYWIDMSATGVTAEKKKALVPRLHALLGSNTSDLGSQRYSVTFTGEEFYLRDHFVRSEDGSLQKVLPGVVYLEMARAAIEQAVPITSSPAQEPAALELTNIVWAQPIVVAAEKQVSIALAVNDRKQIEFVVSSYEDGAEILHCQGRGIWTNPSLPAKLDLLKIRKWIASQGSMWIESESVYAAWERIGFYGPSLQTVTGINQGGEQILASLKLPEAAAATQGDYVLHPSMLDGALQSHLGLKDGWEGPRKTRLPFALELLRILSPLKKEMLAWIRYAPDSKPADKVVKLDIDLCDPEGHLCVSMHGFATRALERELSQDQPETSPAVGQSIVAEKPEEDPVGMLTLVPIWHAMRPVLQEAAPSQKDKVVMFGGEFHQQQEFLHEYPRARVLPMLPGATIEHLTGQLAGLERIDHLIWILPTPTTTLAGPSTGYRAPEELDFLIVDQQRGVLFGFLLIKALLQLGYGAHSLGWTVITTGTYRVPESNYEPINPLHGGVAGLLGSMAKEYANWKVRLIDVADGPLSWTELLRLGADIQGDGWAYRGGEWYRPRLIRCESKDVINGSLAEQSFRQGGVYVVIGGAGGLGEVLTEYLIRTYAAQVVWVGRRATNEVIAGKQRRVAAAAGGEPPLYIAADARHREQLEGVRQTVQQRYGRIHGVIHSAIVLADKSLANMAEEQFRDAFSAKVDAAVRLHQVFGQDPLDWILYFSSAQSFLKASGQSNYAAGCTFLDAFASWQAAQAAYPVKVMNWGYWAHVGVVAQAVYQERMARQGWGSIEPEQGMAGLERLLHSSRRQDALIHTTGSGVQRALGVLEGQHLSFAAKAVPVLTDRLNLRLQTIASLAPVADLLHGWEQQWLGVEAVLVEMLRHRLRKMGLTGKEANPQHIVVPNLQRWLAESLRILDRHAAPGQSAEGSMKTEDELWRDWDRESAKWAARSEGMRAQVRLVDASLRALGEVLKGIKQPTDVLFPKSSLHLVQGVYKNNAVSDFFNDFMADVVDAYVEERNIARPPAAAMKLRVLELGAGTGGSTERILPRLDRFRNNVEEYTYTDLSRVFLLHGEQTFAAGRQYLRFTSLDVEKGLEGQAVEPGTYDLVLATNVLHATRSIRETVRNAKAALKQNGLLVLNEISTTSVYAHLTFGLLRGWWFYEDPNLRMDGSPGLTAEAWKRILEEEGMRNVRFPAHAAHGAGQQIILAESDGVFRQAEVAVARPRQERSTVARLSTALFMEQTENSGLLESLEAWLTEAIQVLLKVKREDVDRDAEFIDLGFDSISLTGLANYVNQGYGLELMPTIFFEHVTLKSFAAYLIKNHGDLLAEKLVLKTAVRSAKTASGKNPPPQEVTPPPGEGSVAGSAGRFTGKGKRPLTLEMLPVEISGAEPIAIIGVSGKFPGAEDLGELWENLKAGKDSIVEIPADRWDWRSLEDEEKNKGNSSSVKWGGFIDGVDEFDPLFFGISPFEAQLMDPQQRLLMTYGWKAIEDAGYAGGQLWGSRTGIFVGTGGTGYGELLQAQQRPRIEGYSETGLVPSVGPNRLSYFLNLHGPSEPIETACSSSLVAIHRAIRAMRDGECDMTIVGGVNTLLSPVRHVGFSKAGMLSLDGKCKTFSSRANGFVRGEGVAMMVLKKLSAAERDGDHIYGLIRSSSENHGGRANSLTAPNPQAQADLITDAFRRAGVHPASVTYIEAHGTGTALGDPIEINGLKSGFQALFAEAGDDPESCYCGLGSVKTNIGHLELAAGIAGVVKVLLQMKHQTLVRSLHCEDVNPYIKLEESPFYLVQETQPWIRRRGRSGAGMPLRAGVSSFGFGGVNAHVVLEEYISTEAVQQPQREQEPAIVVLSARNADRLTDQARQLAEAIARHQFDEADLAAMAYTLQIGRQAMEHRLALIVSSIQELGKKLEDFAAGRAGKDRIYQGEAKRTSETAALFRDDEELQEAVTKWIQRGKWPKVLDLWVKGVEVPWSMLYDERTRPRRISMPTYPFARERYWAEAAALLSVTEVQPAFASVLHPLLHTNTSSLGRQCYRSIFTGNESFLSDHKVRVESGALQKVLPGVAYLEMALAAVEHASADPDLSGSTKRGWFELRDTVWLQHLDVVGPQQQVSVAIHAEDDNYGVMSYEIYSGEGEREITYCRGEAVAVPEPAPARLDLAQLMRKMDRGRWEGSRLYPVFAKMGLEYGPTHRGLAFLAFGDGQLLAELRLPEAAIASLAAFALHPSLMDSALQASLGLLLDFTEDVDHLPTQPPVPFALSSLHMLSPCQTEMFAWVRYARRGEPSNMVPELDIDLCDPQGNVCVQMRGFVSRVLAGARTAIGRDEDAAFDAAFYEKLIADVVSCELSVEEAVEIG